MVLVRKAKVADLSVLLKLERQFDQDEREIVLKEDSRVRLFLRQTSTRFSSKRMRQWLVSRSAVVFIAEIDSVPCGFTVAWIGTSPAIFEPKRYGFVGIMFVQREYRGRRISSLMKKETFAWFTNRKVKYVGLMVMKENKHARRLYEKWGFRDLVVSMWKMRSLVASPKRRELGD